MADQLLGVLREIVAIESGIPRPGSSANFGGDPLALDAGDPLAAIQPDARHIPLPAVDTSDPGLQAVMNIAGLPDILQRIGILKAAAAKLPKSREIRLHLAKMLTDNREYVEAEKILAALGEEDAWDWRVIWYRARNLLAQGNADAARAAFDQVYFDLPGELAPKLALGFAAELSYKIDFAIAMYDLVSRTDPSFVSASFGLARCLLAKADRRSAVAALDRIPQSSGLYLRSRVEAARTLIRADRGAVAKADLTAASKVTQSVALEGRALYQLKTQILNTALTLLASRSIQPDKSVSVMGQPLMENAVRSGLEESFRSLANLTSGDEKILLIDQANRVRPRTLF
jgi:serine/threonine-protein kinase PknG